MKKHWFKNKKYGWGPSPMTWQGWIVTLVYLVLLIELFLRIDSASHSGSDTLIGFAPWFILASLIFLVICRITGEEEFAWNWGNRGSKSL